MNTFRTYLRILKAKPFNILLYFGIFFLMVYLFIFSQGESESPERGSYRYGVFVEDRVSASAQELLEYLDTVGTVQIEYPTENDLRQAVFDYVIHFGFVIQADGKLREVRQGDPMVAMAARQQMEEYVRFTDFFEAHPVENPEQTVSDLLALRVDTELLQRQETGPAFNLQFYYNFASYVTVMALFMTMLVVTEVFQKKPFRTRTRISRTPYGEVQREILMGHMLLVAALFLLVVGLSVVVAGWNAATGPVGLRLILNYGVFVLSISMFCFLITRVVTNARVGQMIANIVGLGTSFISGVFLPRELLTPQVLKISQVFPTYWFVSANEKIVEHSPGYGRDMLVVAFMGLAFFLLILLVDRRSERVAQGT